MGHEVRITTTTESIPEAVAISDLVKLCFDPRKLNFSSSESTGIEMRGAVRIIQKSILCSDFVWDVARDAEVASFRQNETFRTTLGG
jgi:hypothetical protein